MIIGIGAEPRTELAEQLGLACAGGIVVDAYARTSDPAIVAAGDCAVTPHPAAADGSLVRFESYGHATDHAKVAAATLAGVPARYDAVPWFWSDQGPLKLQIAGLSAGFDQTVLRGDPAGSGSRCSTTAAGGCWRCTRSTHRATTWRSAARWRPGRKYRRNSPPTPTSRWRASRPAR